MSFWDGVTPQAVANAEDKFSEFEIGDNEAFIKTVEQKVSEAGNDMMVITFANNRGAEIKHFIVDSEYKMPKLKQLYLSFDIPMGSTDVQSWKGKRGIVVCKEGKSRNGGGKTYKEVSYLRPLSGPTTHPQQPNIKPGYMTPQNSIPPQGQGDDNFDDDIPF
jgi:hypothetical protein